MAKATFATLDLVKQIEGNSIVDGVIEEGDLILVTKAGKRINAGGVLGNLDPALADLLQNNSSIAGKVLVARVNELLNRNDVPVGSVEPMTRGKADQTLDQIADRSLEVWDSVHEWWIGPILTRVEEKRMTYSCGYSSRGEVIMWDKHDRDAEPTHVVVGNAGASGPSGVTDDHNAPARWSTDDGTFSVGFWNYHGEKDYFSMRASLDGTALGFMAQNIIDVQVAPGARISYTQVFLHSISGDSYTFWVFVRTDTGWGYQVVSINRRTGAYFKGDFVRVVQVAGLQDYISVSKSGRLLRIAVYVNPAYSEHSIWLLHLNMDTRILTNPLESGWSTGVGQYTNVLDRTPLLANTASTRSRRLFYVHPSDNKVIYAEWATNDVDNASYMEARLQNGTVLTRTLGPAAGPRNGYTPGANYLPGMAYAPDGRIATLHNHPTLAQGEVWIHESSRSYKIKNTGYRLSRACFISNDQLMWLQVDQYTDYNNFKMHQKAISGFPVLQETRNEHPLKTAGSIWIVDPTWDTAWADGIPSSVPNLADFSQSTLANTIGSGGLVERTKRGALHVAAAKNASGNQSVVLNNQDAINALKASKEAGNDVFIGLVYRITREPTSGFAPSSATYRRVGIIGSDSSDILDYRLGPDQIYRGYPTTRASNDVTGTAKIADGRQTVATQIKGGAGTVGTSSAMSVIHNGGANSPMPGYIMYLEVIEDLTKSGRTFAQAKASLDAYVQTLFGAGGRYNSDDYTPPPT